MKVTNTFIEKNIICENRSAETLVKASPYCNYVNFSKYNKGA